MYESDDDWEDKAPAPKRRKSTGLPKERSPPPLVKETNIQLPKKYVKPWTKVIGTAVFEIYDYGNNNNNNNVTKWDNNVNCNDGDNKTSPGKELSLNESNDMSSNSDGSAVENSQVVNNNIIISRNRNGNTLEEWSCSPSAEAGDSRFSTCSSAPPRLVIESIDNGSAASEAVSAASIVSDYLHADTTAAATNGKDSEQKQHEEDHHENLQLQPHQLIQLQPKPATQHCNNNCAALNNSTCSECAFCDNATKEVQGDDDCHKISPLNYYNDSVYFPWY